MKYKVKIGTLMFEAGKFQKDDVVELNEEQAARLKGYVEAIPEAPVTVVAPDPEVTVPVVAAVVTEPVPLVEEKPKAAKPATWGAAKKPAPVASSSV